MDLSALTLASALAAAVLMAVFHVWLRLDSPRGEPVTVRPKAANRPRSVA
jgi:hypothetical protein